MWKLLKAEFSYNKSILITAVIAYILFVIAFIVCSIISSRLIRYNHVMLATLIPAMVASILILSSKSMDKRDRILAVLPITPSSIAFMHISFAVIVWISLVCLFWILPSVLKFVDIDRTTVLVMIYLNGSFVVMNALLFICADVRNCITEKKNFFNLHIDEILTLIFSPVIIVLWIFVFGIPYEFIFGLFEPFRSYMYPLIISSSGVIIINVLGLGLSYLSIEMYVWRKSFLE